MATTAELLERARSRRGDYDKLEPLGSNFRRASDAVIQERAVLYALSGRCGEIEATRDWCNNAAKLAAENFAGPTWTAKRVMDLENVTRLHLMLRLGLWGGIT